MTKRKASDPQNMGTHHRPVLAALIVILSLLSAACTRHTKVDSTWVQEVPHDQQFRNVLVVGVSPSYKTRCRFERLMQKSLTTPDTRVMTSCSHMSSKDPLTREAIVALVGSIGSDAVLSTRLVDSKAGLTEGHTDEARGKTYYKPAGYGYGYDPFYGEFGLPVVYADFVAEQPTLTLRRTIVVSSNLYRAKDAALVYTLNTTAYDKETQFDVMNEITTAIARRLHHDRLVP